MLYEVITPRARPWYKEAAGSPDKAIVSEAYTSTDGQAMLSVAKAVKGGDGILGVVALDISLKNLTDMVSGINIGKSGFVALLQNDGVVISDNFV